MRRTMMDMKAKAKTASRTTAPKAGSLVRCAFACVLALSLALPAEGLSYAFADAAGSDAASTAASVATVENVESGADAELVDLAATAEGGASESDGLVEDGEAAGPDTQPGLLAEHDAAAAQDASAAQQDAPATGLPAAAHPSEDAPLLMSLHGMRAAEAAETAPAAEEDASAAAEGEPAAEDSEGEGSGSAGPEGAGAGGSGPEGGADGSEGGAEDPGASGGEGQAEPEEGAQDGAASDDSIVMEAPEAEAPEDAEGVAPIADAPELRAGGTYVVTKSAAPTPILIGSYATLADAVAACPTTREIHTITLTGADDTAMGDQVTIPAGKSIILTSDTGTRTIVQKKRLVGRDNYHLRVEGWLQLQGITLSGSKQPSSAYFDGSNSGGVLVWKTGYFNMLSGATITNCQRSTGAGLTVVDGANSGETTSRVTAYIRTGAKITGNSAYSGGAGVWVRGGTCYLGGGEISSNANDLHYENSGPSSSSIGGGVLVTAESIDGAWREPIFTMTSGTIRNNKSLAGGGIYSKGGAITIANGEISGNSAQALGSVGIGSPSNAGFGGGIALKNRSGEGFFKMTGGRVSGNSAGAEGGGICDIENCNYINPASGYDGISIGGNAAFSGNTAGFGSATPPSSPGTLSFPKALLNNNDLNYRDGNSSITYVANNGTTQADRTITASTRSLEGDVFPARGPDAFGFTAPPDMKFSHWALMSSDGGVTYGGVRADKAPFVRGRLDLKAVAQWVPVTCNISFDAAGGTPAPSALSNVAGTAAFGPLPVVTKPGSQFLGWFTTHTVPRKASSGAIVKDVLAAGASVRDGWTYTLRAHWLSSGDVCQIIRPDGSGVEELYDSYSSLAAAFAAAQDGDRIELLRDTGVSTSLAFTATGTVTLATAPASQPVSGALPWQGAAPAAGGRPQAVVTGSGSSGVSMTGGGTLELKDVAFSSFGRFSASSSGGFLVLGDGAAMRDGLDSLFSGTVSNSGFTMKSGSLITGWESPGSARGIVAVSNGGSISIEGGTVEDIRGNSPTSAILYDAIFYASDWASSVSMSGGEIKDCTVRKAVFNVDGKGMALSGGQVVDNVIQGYSDEASAVFTRQELKVQGDPVVARNVFKDPASGEESARNVYAGWIRVDGPLQASAEMHVTDGVPMADGATFGSYDAGFGANANVFANDANGLRGADAGGGDLRWGGGGALCQIIRTGASGTETFASEHGSLQEAFDAAQDGDRIEMLRDMAPSGEARFVRNSAAEIVLTTAPVSNPVSGASGWKGAAPAAGEAPRAVLNGSTVFFGGDSLRAAGQVRGVLKDVVLDGTDVLMEGNAGVSLGSGAWIRNVVGKSAIAYGTSPMSGIGLNGYWDHNDLSTFNKVEMLDGSRISDCEPGSTALIDIWDESNYMAAALYIRGGEIADNVAAQSVLIDTTVAIEQLGVFEMSGGSIRNNEAVSIAAADTTYSVANVYRFTISGGEVRDNRSPAAADPATGALCAPAFNVFWLKLSGGTITGNTFGSVARPEEWGSALTDMGGAVKASKFTLEGDPYVYGNTTLQGYPCDVSAANDNDQWSGEAGTLVLTGPLAPTAKVGVWKVSGNSGSSSVLPSVLPYDPNGHRMLGDKFSDYSATPGANVNLERLVNNTNGLVGVDDKAGGVVWGNPVCQRIATGSGTPTFVEAYGSVENALSWAKDGDRVELLKDSELASLGYFTASGSVELTTAPAVQTVPGAQAWQGTAPAPGAAPRGTVTRTDGSGGVSIFGGGDLVVKNIVLDGGSALATPVEGTVPLFASYSNVVRDLGGSLVLDSGSVVRNVRAAGSAFSGYGPFGSLFYAEGAASTFAMKDGSLVADCSNASGLSHALIGAYRGGQVAIDGGVIENCNMGGGYLVNADGADEADAVASGIAMTGGEIRNNTAGAILRSGNLTFSGGKVQNNACFAWALSGHRILAFGGAPSAIASEVRLLGGEVTGNGGGGVYSADGTVLVQGTPQITGNTNASGDAENLYVAASSNLVVNGALQTSARVGVTMGDASKMAEGARFGAYDAGFGANVGIFENDADPSLAAHDWGGGTIGWGQPFLQIIRPNAAGVEELFSLYGTLKEAFADAQGGDRVEVLDDRTIHYDYHEVAEYAASGSIELTTAPAVQPVAGASAWQGPAPSAGEAPRAELLIDFTSIITPPVDVTFDGALARITGGGSLVAGNLELTTLGAGLECFAFRLEQGSALTLDDGFELRDTVVGAVVLDGSGSEACSLAIEPSASFHDVQRGSQSLVHCAGQGSVDVRGGEFYNCVAVTCYGSVFHLGAGSTLSISGGSFHGNGLYSTSYVSGMSGGVLYSQGDVELSGGEFYSNYGFYGSVACVGLGVPGSPATLKICGTANIHDNSSNAVSPIGGAVYVADGCPIDVEGSPVIADNVARYYGDGSGSERPADLRFNSSKSVLTVTGPLGAAASIGVRDEAGISAAGQQFGVYDPGANANLDSFFVNFNPALVGSDGGMHRVVWKLSLVDASFTKVGVSQEPGAAHGLYSGLPGAEFNVYEYVGTTPLTQAALDSGAVGPASKTSSDWAPLLDANGTVGAAGSASNVPHGFVSNSNGKVDLTKVKPDTWLMLVETQAPSGYQLPQGQWAFKVSDPDGDGTFDIDTSNVLACKGQPGGGGSLPPAMATSVNTPSGTETGVFVVNTPEFGLPHAGVLPQLPMALLAGAALVAAAWALRRLRRRSRRA